MKRLCPRAKVKSIVKSHNRKAQLQKNTELLLFLEYILFLKHLAKEAQVEKSYEKGAGPIKTQHVSAVAKKALKKFRGSSSKNIR